MFLFIYCAGGYGKEVYDLAQRINTKNFKWKAIYFIDDLMSDGKETYLSKNYSYQSIEKLFSQAECEFVIANGEPFVREKLQKKINDSKYTLTTLIDPSAIVSTTSVIKEGVIIGPNAIISSNTKINKNVAINVGGIVGHDISIGKNSVVSSYVNIGGNSSIGENSYIGMGAMVKENTLIGNNVIIGMGSVVYKDISDNIIALGNPARPMRANTDRKVFK